MKNLTEIILEPIKNLKHKDVLGLHEPDLTGNELRYVTECIQTGWVSSVGRFVDEFELKLAEFVGVPKAVAVVNGTSALHLALILMNVKSEEEVLTPALTFVATSNAIAYTGAIPHFVDSGENDLSVCPVLLESYLNLIVDFRDGRAVNKNTGRIISALVVMHVLGHPAKMDELNRIAKKFNLKLIEDAAEGLGSYSNDKHVGTLSDIGIFSFNGNKIMTTGSGGALVSHNVELMNRAKHLSTTAKASGDGFFYHDEVGYNYRMSNIHAALGVAQLEKMQHFCISKNKLADYYSNFYADYSNVKFIKCALNTKSNYWLCALQLNDIHSDELVKIIHFSHAQGIMLRPLWNLNNTLPMYRNSPSMNLFNAEKHVASCLCLPSSACLGANL